MPLRPHPRAGVCVSDSASVHLGVARVCVCVCVCVCLSVSVSVSVFGQRWGPRLGGGTSGIQGTLTLKGLPGTLSSPHLTMRM